MRGNRELGGHDINIWESGNRQSLRGDALVHLCEQIESPRAFTEKEVTY